MRLLVLADIHANYEALKAVLEKVRGVDGVIVVGDLVDYGPDPDKVLDVVRTLGAKVVRGNHDEAVGRGVDCRCGPATRDLSIYTRANISLKKLGQDDRRYLASLPLRVIVETPMGRAMVVHATPRDPLYRYVYPWTSPEELDEEFRGEEVDLYIVGHSHHQTLRVHRGIHIVNPGSVGQPRDGDPRAAAAIISEEGVEFIRIKYDIDRVVRRLREEIQDDRVFERLASILRSGSV